jgi:hypothetical protein
MVLRPHLSHFWDGQIGLLVAAIQRPPGQDHHRLCFYQTVYILLGVFKVPIFIADIIIFVSVTPYPLPSDVPLCITNVLYKFWCVLSTLFYVFINSYPLMIADCCLWLSMFLRNVCSHQHGCTASQCRRPPSVLTTASEHEISDYNI